MNMESSSPEPLPCSWCSFPESGFKGYVFPVLAIDFEASREADGHKNLWRLSCKCYQLLKGDRRMIVTSWNEESRLHFTSMMATRYFEPHHVQIYYGEATIE